MSNVRRFMEPFAFTDLVDSGSPIKVLARVSVLSSESGGRSRPFIHPYRPNHNFGKPDSREFYIGQIELPEGEEVFPGETRELVVKFLSGRGLRELLHVGREWRIQEGAKLVAIARVLEVKS